MQQFAHKGQTAAFTELYKRYFITLCKYLTWLGKNPTISEDIVQNIFLKIHQAPELFDPKKSFKTWLFVIARNQWKNAIRNEQVRQKHSINSIKFTSDLPSSSTHDPKLENHHLLKGAIANLSEKHREIITLKYSSNFSIQEISEILNCSKGTVKSRLFYAIQALKKQL